MTAANFISPWPGPRRFGSLTWRCAIRPVGSQRSISAGIDSDSVWPAALQSIMQKLGKSWYQRRGLRIFRDDTSLSATPSLWPAIEQALAQSRYLILLASPEAAASPWVSKEVAYWLEQRGINTLLIALTDGDLAWDESTGDFAWSAQTPLPPFARVSTSGGS